MGRDPSGFRPFLFVPMPKDVHGVMSEFKRGDLHSGSKTGKVVKDRKQAIAIALSEQRQMKGKRSMTGRR